VGPATWLLSTLWCWISPGTQACLDVPQAMTPQPVVSPGSCTIWQSTQNTKSIAGRRYRSSWGTETLQSSNGECRSSCPVP
jgi:hypothetical protein